MSIYKISFSQLRQDNLRATFAAFERAFQKMRIEVYLIGALARDTWFAGTGIRTLGTKDIDFAVLIPDPATFQQLKDYLTSEEHFTATKNEYTLVDEKGYHVDLLPFGSVEIEGKQILDHQGHIYTNISGFQEVYDQATTLVEFDGQFQFRVSSLAGIIVLKLIAWDDRPEMRGKDIQDISLIIHHYFALEEALIYSRHADLFTIENIDLPRLSARALGREMALVLNRNALLRDRIRKILSENQAVLAKSMMTTLPTLSTPESAQTLTHQYAVLREILLGIMEQR